MQEGQKVVHIHRPELGIGEVQSVNHDRLDVRFAASRFSGIPVNSLALADEADGYLPDSGQVQPIPAVLTPEAQLHNVSQRYGITALWHMTSRENVATILANGLMSRHGMHQSGHDMVDISDATVQNYRVAKGTRNGMTLHDYVPLYLRAKNPMLFCRRSYNPTLCLLEVDLHACLLEGVLLTDGNAASRDTCFYENLSDLRFLDWQALNASYWNNVPDGKRKRCAEVLVPHHLPASFIVRVHAATLDTCTWLEQQGIKATFSPQRFF